MTFSERLREIQDKKGSRLCVGLDPDPDKIPRHLVENHGYVDAIDVFLRTIINRTLPFACSYKLNLAFFEVLGPQGIALVERLIDDIPLDALVIADAKRGDIGNTARFYAASVFGKLDADAVTISPYMGRDSIAPFLEYPGKLAFVLVRTSNPGANDLQMQMIGDVRVYERVAQLVDSWESAYPGEAGFVVGATDEQALRSLREAYPTKPFLIPGVGAQGGDPARVVAASATSSGPILVNSSRSILYASNGEDFADAAEAVAKNLSTLLAG